jgi:hypothetical protein
MRHRTEAAGGKLLGAITGEIRRAVGVGAEVNLSARWNDSNDRPDVPGGGALGNERHVVIPEIAERTFHYFEVGHCSHFPLWRHHTD